MKCVWLLICGSLAVLVSGSFGLPAHGHRHEHGLGAHVDQVPAATGHHHHTGRVQIKVYRGQSKSHGHYEHFAPYGYWVRQPADDHHHHYH